MNTAALASSTTVAKWLNVDQLPLSDAMSPAQVMDAAKIHAQPLLEVAAMILNYTVEHSPVNADEVEDALDAWFDQQPQLDRAPITMDEMERVARGQ